MKLKEEKVRENSWAPGSKASDNVNVAQYQESSNRRPVQGPFLHTSQAVADACKDIAKSPKENLVVLSVNPLGKLIRRHVIATGTMLSVETDPKEVFLAAIKDHAFAIFVVHNHPSGDPKPSQDDIRVTDRLRQAGDIIGINLVDHVIVSPDGGHVSVRGGPDDKGMNYTEDEVKRIEAAKNQQMPDFIKTILGQMGINPESSVTEADKKDPKKSN
jgi:DNA repair protein RadC